MQSTSFLLLNIITNKFKVRWKREDMSYANRLLH